MKRLIKKVVVATGLDFFFVQRSDAAIILGLHQVEENTGSMISQRVSPVSSDVFEEILRYLQFLGYSFVPLSEIVGNPNRSKKVAITFDDGFKSVYVNAFPILKKFHAPFTVFLTTAMLGANRLLWLHRIYAAVDRLAREDIGRIMERCALKDQQHRSLKDVLGDVVCREAPSTLLHLADELANQAGLNATDDAQLAKQLYLTPLEVTEMMQNGMTIGAHGHDHWCLETLDPSLTATEILTCAQKIKEYFGVQVEHYATSFGRSNTQTKSILEGLGLRSLSTVKSGFVWTNTNPYALPRLMVGADSDVTDLGGQITLLLILQRFIGH